MKNITAVILFIGCTTLACGQDIPRYEIFGGYTFANQLRLPLAAESSKNGWQAGFKYNIASRIGLVAEVDGRGGEAFRLLEANSATTLFLRQPVSTYTFLFGPEVNVYRNRRVAINLRALAGVLHADQANGGVSVFSTEPLTGQQQFISSRGLENNTFSMVAGGNVDVRLGRGFSWRVVQPEVQLTRINGENRPNFRVSTGLVFGFGKH
jgi:hypothetical protein